MSRHTRKELSATLAQQSSIPVRFHPPGISPLTVLKSPFWRMDDPVGVGSAVSDVATSLDIVCVGSSVDKSCAMTEDKRPLESAMVDKMREGSVILAHWYGIQSSQGIYTATYKTKEAQTTLRKPRVSLPEFIRNRIWDSEMQHSFSFTTLLTVSFKCEEPIE